MSKPEAIKSFLPRLSEKYPTKGMIASRENEKELIIIPKRNPLAPNWFAYRGRSGVMIPRPIEDENIENNRTANALMIEAVCIIYYYIIWLFSLIALQRTFRLSINHFYLAFLLYLRDKSWELGRLNIFLDSKIALYTRIQDVLYPGRAIAWPVLLLLDRIPFRRK